ncbi:Polygalacturonase inhibitor-like protein [Drosera capensis]
MAIPSTPLRPFVVTFIFLSLSLFVSSICDPKDKKILLQIQESLGNPDKLVSAWELNTDCCNGWGITCNSDGRVTDFYASFSNNPFKIPSSIGELDYLEAMTFSDLPNLTGTIPRTITKLKYLQSIRISNTRLSGHVPEFLGQIQSLQSIDLEANNLSGSIPLSLGKLQCLSTLNLYGNHLHGPIPDIFSSLNRTFNVQNPLTIVLSNNELSGELPKSMGNVSIQWIDVSENQLTGDASFLFGQEKKSLCEFGKRVLGSIQRKLESVVRSDSSEFEFTAL